MVVDVITHGEVQCCAFCQGSVAQEVTVIFGAIEAYFGSVSSSVSGAGPSVKHYFRITFRYIPQQRRLNVRYYNNIAEMKGSKM